MKSLTGKMTGKEKETIFGSIVATLIVVFVLLNFSTGDKRVGQEIEHLYSVHDPQFLRAIPNGKIARSGYIGSGSIVYRVSALNGFFPQLIPKK